MPPIDRAKVLRMVADWLEKMETGHHYGSMTLNSQDGKVQGLRFEMTYREGGEEAARAVFTATNLD